MKIPRLTKWRMTGEMTGLLFFAQSLEEILFDHTVDSFKAPALNTHSSVLELRSLASELKDGTLRSGVLKHVLEELEHRIGTDPALEGEPLKLFNKYTASFNQYMDKLNPNELISLTDSLLLEIRKNYWGQIKGKIKELIEGSIEKHKLTELAKILACEIELRGYSKRYLYNSTLDFFFKSNHVPYYVTSSNQINDFLKAFEIDAHKWQIVYRANEEFLQFRQHSEPFNFKICEKIEDELNNINYHGPFLDFNPAFPLFIVFQDIESHDPFSAGEYTNSRIEFFAEVCCFHQHESNPSWTPEYLVRKSANDFFRLIKPSPNPMRRGIAVRMISIDSLEKTVDIMAGMHFDARSMYLFSKAMDYHRAAIQTTFPESQLVSLWAAIEGFLPRPKNDENQARIQQYIEGILPSLALTYSEKIFNYLSNGLYYGGRDIRAFVEDIPTGANFFTKTVHLLVCQELQTKRTELYGMLDNHPLLRYWCNWANENFRNTKRIRKSLNSHNQRVKWHIQRIYTTRNQIVHSARALPYLNTLVENLHTYFDVLINSIIQIGTRAESIISVESAIKYLQIQEKVYMQDLEGPKIKCISDNCFDLLFGKQNPLRR